MRQTVGAGLVSVLCCFCATALTNAVAASPDACASYMVNTATGARVCFVTGVEPVVHRVYTRAADDAESSSPAPMGLPSAPRGLPPPLNGGARIDETARLRAPAPSRDGMVPGVTYRIRNYSQPNGDVIQTRQRAGSAEVRIYQYRR